MSRIIDRYRKRLTFANVVSLLALFVALGGVTFAATSLVGPNGTIHGCVDKKHRLTVVKSNAKCGRAKTSIVWSQKGRPGTPGRIGPAGPGAVRFDLPVTPAAASPTPVTLATIGGITYSATCKLTPSDHVELATSITTGGGTWDADGTAFLDGNGTFTQHELGISAAASGGGFYKIAVVPGSYVRQYANGIFITSGSTRQVLNYDALADANTSARDCSVTGVVTPAR